MYFEQANSLASRDRLAEIEKRIDVCLRSAYERIVDVGRYLNAAKSEKLVPHGQWEGWVRRVTGMNERQAQRWMQIAREVPEGSYLSQLDVSKMRMILALPEPDREPVAQKAVEEGLDTAQVKAEIDALRARAERAEGDCRNLQAFAESRTARITELEKRLRDAEQATADKGISAEAAAKIEKLKAELDNAKEFGRLQAEKRQLAQNELIELRQSMAARGEDAPSARLTGDELIVAAREFIQVAGVMPHMGREFAVMGARDKRQFEQALEMVRQWAEGARRALEAVAGTVEV